MRMYIKRDLEKKILQFLDDKEIIAVVGPRQCGKTTLINHILDGTDRKINRITFDNQKILALFEEDVDSFVQKHIDGYEIVFIDEVQYARDSGRNLKYIYDTQNVKLIISGSSSSELSISSLKFLVGRIIIFTLLPFSFQEFLRSKDERLSRIYDQDFKKTMVREMNTYLKEFILYGGYPRVVLSEGAEKKKTVLENIFNTYLLKEIREILQLSNEKQLIRLMKGLAHRAGNMVVYDKLGAESGFDHQQLKQNLGILEKTYICKLISTYHTNKITELVKAPKAYFLDTGFRNACLGSFHEERGAMLENFLFSELMKEGYDVKYWRTKAKAEVDFVVESGRAIPIEVKSQASSTTLPRSFASFISRYKPSEAYIASPEYEAETRKGKTKVIFSPIVKIVKRLA